MGELSKQIMAGGPPLADLNEEQAALYDEMRKGGAPFTRGVLHRMGYHTPFKSTIRQGVHEFCGKASWDDTNAHVELFFIHYEDYIGMLSRRGDIPFSEDDFRELLVWAGHGPAFWKHREWVRIFRKAIVKANDDLANRRLYTAQPYDTWLHRIYQAAL